MFSYCFPTKSPVRFRFTVTGICRVSFTHCNYGESLLFIIETMTNCHSFTVNERLTVESFRRLSLVFRGIVLRKIKVDIEVQRQRNLKS